MNSEVFDIVPNLDAIARQAFEVLAGMQPETFNAHHVAEPLNLEASVFYEGEKDAPSGLRIRTNIQFALEFSERFLGQPAFPEVNDDVLDAIGELANTVGGNFKGLLNAATTLSAPVVLKRPNTGTIDQSDITLAEITYISRGNGCCLIQLLGSA